MWWCRHYWVWKKPMCVWENDPARWTLVCVHCKAETEAPHPKTEIP